MRRIFGFQQGEIFDNSELFDDIYVRGYETMVELYRGVEAFFAKYNTRKHQTLGMSPEQKYRENLMHQIAASLRPCRYAAPLRGRPPRSCNLESYKPKPI